MSKSLCNGPPRSDGGAAASALDPFHYGRFTRESFLHRARGAMKNNDSRSRVGKSLRRGCYRLLELSQRLMPLTGHAQPRYMNSDTDRSVSVELRLRQPVAG